MKFRKKPGVFEASQWFKNGDHTVVKYATNPYVWWKTPCLHCGKEMIAHGWIETLEGGHIVCPGDWVVTGVNGEFYPIKDDIFKKTYEKVDE